MHFLSGLVYGDSCREEMHFLSGLHIYPGEMHSCREDNAFLKCISSGNYI